MRGKHLNCGIRGGLWDETHLQRMGPAVWLYGWLIHRQTRERNGVGLVLGGSPLTYEIIQADTGFPRRTLQRWLAALRHEGYVRVRRTCHSRMVIEILKAKKFTPKQLGFPQGNFFAPNSSAPLLAGKNASSAPTVARKEATCGERSPSNAMPYATAAASHRQYKPERQINGRPHSGDSPNGAPSVARPSTAAPFFRKKENAPRNFASERTEPSVARTGHGFADKNNLSGREAPASYPPRDPFRFQQSRKAQREAAVEAELRVGAGPEVRRE